MRDARLVARFLPNFPKFSQAYNAPLLLSLAAFVCLLSICSAHQAQTAPPAGACPSVLIVGASGYIGSFLFEQLRRPSPLGCNATVTGVSRSPSAHMSSQGVQALDCRQISTEFLSSFDVVLYLGGLSSRVGCSSADWDEVVNQNVNSIASLASRMHQAQLLIFASTSAIADGLNHTASDDDHGDEASLDA
jgi:nucleoside-diphosphate-sugar epimerase